MATDKTDVPIPTIMTVALVSIGTLVGLRFVFTDYFHRMYDEREQQVNLAQTSPLLERERAAANARLSGISAAMSAVASGQRPDAIATRPGAQDNAALQGWTLMPHALPAHPTAAPPPAPAVPVQPADAPSTVLGPQGLTPEQQPTPGMVPAPTAPMAPPAAAPGAQAEAPAANPAAPAAEH